MVIPQSIGNALVAPSDLQIVLQDVCLSQPALLVGLISVLTGYGLQDDLAASIRKFISRGLDILGRQTAPGSEQAAEAGGDAQLTQAARRGDSGGIGGLADNSTRT
jgi:hypothetical protein